MPKDRRNSIVPEVNRGTLEDKILRSATTSSHQASFVHSMYTWCLVRPSDDVRGELPGSLPSSVSFGLDFASQHPVSGRVVDLSTAK